MAELLFFFNYKGERIESKDLSGNVIPALNWQDAEKVIKRSDKYDGITYVFTNEFIFIGNIVRLIDIARANGIGEELGIEIWSLDEETLDHVQEYSGLVDLPSAKKEINASGNIQYTITTKQIGFESDFDFSFETEINLTEPTDLNGNPILQFARPFDYVGLKPLGLKLNVDVESEGDNIFDGGSPGSLYTRDRDYYSFYTINHSKINQQEFEENFKNNSTRNYIDFDWDGPDPTGAGEFDHDFVLRNAPHSLTNNNLWYFKAEINGEYRITYNWNLNFRLNTDDTRDIVLRYRYWLLFVILDRSDPLNVTRTIEPVSEQSNGSLNNRQYEFNDQGSAERTYQMEAGQEFYIIPYQGYHINSSNPALRPQIGVREDVINVDTSNLLIRGITRFEQTNPTAYLAHEAFSRLTNKITGKFNAFKSNFYGRIDSQPRTYDEDGEGSLTAFMNGQHLRGWTIGNAGGSEKEFNTSFKDLFESEQAKHNIGLGVINNEIVIEDINFFYDKTTELLDLGCIPDLQIEYDLDEYYNRIEVGYSEWKNQENKGGAGLQEFNANKKYNTELNVIDKVLQIISKFITAGYTIETTRREQIFLDIEKETQNDLKNFAVALLRTGITAGAGTATNPAFINETYDSSDPLNPWLSITGIDFPEEAYNVRWQPARMIRNWGNRIRLSIDNANKELLLQVTNGNKNFSSRLKTETASVSEGDNVTSSQLDESLFNGELYTFEQRLTNDQIKAIETNPYGYVKFTDSFNKEYRGFFKGELSINLYTKIASATLRGYNF